MHLFAYGIVFDCFSNFDDLTGPAFEDDGVDIPLFFTSGVANLVSFFSHFLQTMSCGCE